MNEERLTQILLEPKVFEKATRLDAVVSMFSGFEVDASKPEIKALLNFCLK